MLTAGIDIGSRTTKAVIVKNEEIIALELMPTGGNSPQRAKKVFYKALENINLDKQSIEYIVATGYGRLNIDFAHDNITEITCHAFGAYKEFNKTQTIIDVGGQDSKVISLDKKGKVEDFVMNDKCAAGTGRFLEVMAETLEIPLEKFGDISQNTNQAAKISSTCTVFAESEVINLIAKGKDKGEIVRGIHRAIVKRLIGMVEKIGLKKEVTMTGGVCLNKGLRQMLEQNIGVKINIPRYPQYVGAYGAALIAHLTAKGDF